MKILHTVESYLPARHGMSEVVRQVSERLAAKGHDVTVATGFHPGRESNVISGVKVAPFQIFGKSAIGVSGDVHGYQRFLLESGFDVVANFAAQQWATDLALPLLPEIRGKKVFIPTGFSALGDPMFRSYFEGMKTWMALYDACVYLSDDYRDVRFARAAGLENGALIPNGAAGDEFDGPLDPSFRKRMGIPENHILLVHVAGYLSVAKGQIDAVKIFSNSGLQNCTLLLVCGEFGDSLFASLKPKKLARAFWHLLRGNGMSGFAPSWQLGVQRWFSSREIRSRSCQILTAALGREDTVNAFQCADLLLFPSRIECSPLVLFEAAAAGTPFLVTDVGNSAEIIRWTGGGRLLPGFHRQDREGSFVPDIQKGARLLNEVWRDEPGRQAMAALAKKAWRENFQWEKIADRYEELYSMLVRGEDMRGKFPPPPDAR